MTLFCRLSELGESLDFRSMSDEDLDKYDKSRDAAYGLNKLHEKHEKQGHLSSKDLRSLLRAHRNIFFKHSFASYYGVEERRKTYRDNKGNRITLGRIYHKNRRVAHKNENHHDKTSHGKHLYGKGPSSVEHDYHDNGNRRYKGVRYYDQNPDERDLHREDGPASESHDYYEDGSLSRHEKSYKKHGSMHRDGGPSYTLHEFERNGKLERSETRYHQDGNLHRDDGPARDSRTFHRNGKHHIVVLRHYKNDRRHREDGPADQEHYYNEHGSLTKSHEWHFINGREVYKNDPRRATVKKAGPKPAAYPAKDFDPTVERFKRLNLSDTPKRKSEKKEPDYDPTVERFRRPQIDSKRYSGNKLVEASMVQVRTLSVLLKLV